MRIKDCVFSLTCAKSKQTHR